MREMRLKSHLVLAGAITAVLGIPAAFIGLYSDQVSELLIIVNLPGVLLLPPFFPPDKVPIDSPGRVGLMLITQFVVWVAMIGLFRLLRYVADIVRK